MSVDQHEQRLAKRQKQYLTFGAVGLASCYFAYRIYRSDSLAALQELRRRLSKSLDGYGKSILLGSDIANTIVEDLKEFLASDTDELPQSLRQLAKLAKSEDVVQATSRLAAAALGGALGSASQGLKDPEDVQCKEPKKTFLEQAVDVLSTEKGLNLVNLAVSIACRSSIKALYESSNGNSQSSRDENNQQHSSWWHRVVELGATPQGEHLYQNCIGVFVREGMKVYMGSMEGVNPWEDFLGSICKPERQQTVDRVTRLFVNELVLTFLKRSRHSKVDGKGAKSAAVRQSILNAAARNSNASPQALAASEGPAGVVVCDQALEGGAALHPATTRGALLREDASAASPSSMSPYIIAAQQLMNPDVRGLLTVIVGTAAFEGVRSFVFAAKEMATGVPGTPPLYHQQQPSGSRQIQQLTSRALGTLLLFVFMPVTIFLAGRRAALS